MNEREWLEIFRGIGSLMRKGLPSVLDRENAQIPIGRGAGGDKTFPVDKWAEDIVVEALNKAHAAGAVFTLISEELGIRKFGDNRQIILVDPIDGSNNAKNGVPFFSFSVALLEDERLDSLRLGYVINLAVGDEFHAIRGEGAFKNGKLLKTPDTDEVIITAYEATDPAHDLPRLLPLLIASRRTRCFGSTALDLTYLASGAVSVLATATASRAFDYAAGMLILQEAGGVVTDLMGNSLGDVKAGLDRTVPLLAAKNRAAHRKALELLNR